MKTIKAFSLAVVAAGMLCSTASASTIFGNLTSTFSASGGPTAFNFQNATSVPLSVSQFNCAGLTPAGSTNCQLTSIHFGVSSTTQSNYTVTNNSGGDDDITINANSVITIAGATTTNPKFVIATPSSTTTFTLADGATQSGSVAATGAATADYNCAGATCTLVSNTGNTPSSPINSAPFIGAGNITLYAKGLNAGFAACAACTATISGNASETVSVQYDYSYDVADTGVPEPATFAMFGGALIGLGFIRRRATK